VAADCPPGTHLELVRGWPTCVRDVDPAPLPVRLPVGEARAVAAVEEARLLAGGNAVAAARALLTADFVEEVKAEFDRNGDRRISFAEVLGADLLAMARRLAASRSAGGPGVGSDAELDAILTRMQERMAADLALGSGNESAPPPVPIEGALGFPRVVLDQASVPPARVR
jgi:hypothetical protein